MRIVACARLDGALDRLSELRRAVEEEQAEMVVFAGSLLGSEQSEARAGDRARGLHTAMHELAALPCAVAVVPGEHDAPERRVLPVLAGREWAEHHLYCVHGMGASTGDLAVAGFGGRITGCERETESALHYPGWEAGYRTAFLAQREQAPLVMVFHTPPARVHDVDLVDGMHVGSRDVTELIGTWSPPVAVVAGDLPSRQRYAATVVVSPGRLDRGEYAVFDPRGRDVRFRSAAPAARN